MWKAAIVTLALSLFVVRPAAAQSKSWNAAKRSVTPKAVIVFGGNLDAFRSTSTYGSLLQMLFAQEPDAKQAFEMIDQACGIDVAASVTDFTVVMKADERPLVVLGLTRNEGELLACLDKIVAGMGAGAKAPKVVAKKKGKITEYSVPGESDKLYLAWLAKDVVAFTDDPSDKAQLSSMLAGKAPKGTIGKFIGKVSTSAPLWGAVAIKQVDKDIGTLLGGYGQIDIKGRDLVGTAHMVLSKAAEATKAAAEANAGLTEIRGKVGKDALLRKVLGSVSVTANGAVIDIGFSVADKDSIDAFQKLDHLM